MESSAPTIWRMSTILRIVTPKQVYCLGRPLPVPEGYPVEPFIVAEIQPTFKDDETILNFQLICVPDPCKDPEKLSKEYVTLAKQASADGIFLIAEIPHTLETRIETAMEREEFEKMQKENSEPDSEPDSEPEPGEDPPSV